MQPFPDNIALFFSECYNMYGDTMLYDFIAADKNAAVPMYRQIYQSIRESIENGSLKKDARLPSIRGLCESLKVSKTTVITAYDQLCAEGYIVNQPQRGFFVAADFRSRPAAYEAESNHSEKELKYYEYDFSTQSIDEEIIKHSVWKKEIKDIINRSYLLTSYGDAQGEEALRIALQKYALGTRGVNSGVSNIVVGAGTQAVLCLLRSLLGEHQRVAMQRASFVQAEYVIRSFGDEIVYFDTDEDGVTIDSLETIRPQVIIINPNFSGQSGKNMPVTRRLELIRWASEHNALIVEDDYNGELRYSTHPMPCVQNYGVEQTVYIGSFSKVLLPSVRISYMVLPPFLQKKYEAVKGFLNQTASKTEQLALAAYIRSGKIDSHIRKARRIYLEKSRVTLDALNRHFPDSTRLFNETSMYVSVRLPFQPDREAIDRELKENLMRVMPCQNAGNEFGISFSGIPIDKIEEGIALLSRIIRKNTTARR